MPQSLTPELVKKIFEGLASGKPDETFAYVADDVKWASLLWPAGRQFRGSIFTQSFVTDSHFTDCHKSGS